MIRKAVLYINKTLNLVSLHRMLMERAEITGLELGQTYAARVRAVNAAGQSQWSLDSEKLVARHKESDVRLCILGRILRFTLLH